MMGNRTPFYASPDAKVFGYQNEELDNDNGAVTLEFFQPEQATVTTQANLYQILVDVDANTFDQLAYNWCVKRNLKCWD